MARKKTAKKSPTKKASAKEKDLGGKPVPRIFKTPESKWPELTFGHGKKVPLEILSNFEINDGCPDSEGKFLFFYSAQCELIGWAMNDSKHKKKLQSLSKFREQVAIGTLCGDKGRNGTSWAVKLNCMEGAHFRSYCVLFIELREVNSICRVSSDDYAGTLRSTLESHLRYLNGNGGEYCSEPDSLWSAEEYLKQNDPKGKLKVRAVKKELEQKELEIDRRTRQEKKELAKWFIQSCIDQL